MDSRKITKQSQIGAMEDFLLESQRLQSRCENAGTPLHKALLPMLEGLDLLVRSEIRRLKTPAKPSKRTSKTSSGNSRGSSKTITR